MSLVFSSVHFSRFNQPKLEFPDMLAIMSAVKVGNADKVLIHSNTELNGEFWDVIKNNTR